MKFRFHTIMLLALLLVAGCQKENGFDTDSNGSSGSVVITQEDFATGNITMDVKFGDYYLYELGPIVENEQIDSLIELHYEVLPFYVYEGVGLSGDYYAVQGYAVAHNALADRTREFRYGDYTMRFSGWYMGRLELGFQLLSPEGKALNQDEVQYYVTPEPSTTIGSTKYKKGFAFSLGLYPVTIGAALCENPGADPSWKTIYKGKISLGFKWEDSATQVLPDQSVEMTTDPWNRAVTYGFKSNNIGPGYRTEDIPITFRTDQRVDFSFVWHVPSGNYCARDYDFGSMKMKISIAPQYQAELDAIDGSLAFRAEKAKNNSLEKIVDLPTINRIPTGEICFKNTTRSYVTDIEVWRTGEYNASKEPYHTVEDNLDTNEESSFLLHEGQYDIVYELVNGDTGESRGKYMIQGIELKAGATKDTSTLKGKKI